MCTLHWVDRLHFKGFTSFSEKINKNYVKADPKVYQDYDNSYVF